MSLFKNWILSLLCSFLSACCHREVGLEALSPCVSISEPASCLLLLLQMEGAQGRGRGGCGRAGRSSLCRHQSCISLPLGMGDVFLRAWALGSTLSALMCWALCCALRVQRGLCWGHGVFKQGPASAFHHPCLSCSSTSLSLQN